MKIYSNSLNYPKQNGLSAIAMVMVLLILGLLLLEGFNQLVTSWQKSMIAESLYYRRFNQASSSLSWAITQNWQIPTEHWQCQTESSYKLKACIKQSLLTSDNYVLLRGEFDGFYLYTLTHYDGIKLLVEKGHWLDYCPEKGSLDCE